jgi:hypothetical protein
MSAFTATQTAQLLQPINTKRVLQDGKGHSHVSQQDITAHLIRMFGFGGFDTEVLNIECVFEEPTKSISKGKTAPDPNRYDVCFRALLRLTVRNAEGKVVCQYEDGSTATAQNQTRGDGHDLAYKSAISLAKKRAAINLGDQFGLSLYNKGQTSALVMRTLIGIEEEPPADVQEGVAQQVSLGNDEVEHESQLVAPEQPSVDPELALDFSASIAQSDTLVELGKVGEALAKSPLSGTVRESLRAEYSARARVLRAAVPA